MRYKTIPKNECINEGPTLPMLLSIHPVYKVVSFITTPVVVLETYTRTYLNRIRNGAIY